MSCSQWTNVYENVAGQGVAARCTGRKPCPEGFPLASLRHAAHVSRLRRGHEAREQKGTNPGPPDRTRRTRRTAIVLKTPPHVLNGTAVHCGPPFGTKRPQVQILSPRPFPQVADLRECCFLRSVFHLPAIATEASREQKGTLGNKKESRGRLRRTEEHRPPSTTQQTQRHGKVLQGTVIPRPQRRGL